MHDYTRKQITRMLAVGVILRLWLAARRQIHNPSSHCHLAACVRMPGHDPGGGPPALPVPHSPDHTQIMYLATSTGRTKCGFGRLLTACILWAAARAGHQVGQGSFALHGRLETLANRDSHPASVSCTRPTCVPCTRPRKLATRRASCRPEKAYQTAMQYSVRSLRTRRLSNMNPTFRIRNRNMTPLRRSTPRSRY